MILDSVKLFAQKSVQRGSQIDENMLDRIDQNTFQVEYAKVDSSN